MGSISYDGHVVVVDDRTLTHLQIVIVNKLRRGDAFLMSWRDSADVGSGRSSIWLHPNVLILFKFEGSRTPAINDQWLSELAASADSSRGLIVTAEHGGVPLLGPAQVRAPRVTVVAPALSPDVT
ncbi:ATP-dependent DNA ligase [Frondihabitans sp. 4ASC-45]|uniref:DUF7882 family protein n=1 Tax=Frondihabitans sp. 4ASC-45 TaxID=3111636 RepID=UPI003C224139